MANSVDPDETAHYDRLIRIYTVCTDICFVLKAGKVNSMHFLVQELEETIGILYASTESSFMIIHLYMSKACANSVPKLLIDEMKESRVNNSHAMLIRYNCSRNPEDFHNRLVKYDET